jgi:hypothetical protein
MKTAQSAGTEHPLLRAFIANQRIVHSFGKLRLKYFIIIATTFERRNSVGGSRSTVGFVQSILEE